MADLSVDRRSASRSPAFPSVGLDARARALAITLVFVGFRLAACPLVGLGVDESYTVAISRELSLSYFDHPPLHQWIAHVFGGLLGWGTLLRLPFIALSGVASWLMFVLGRRLFGEAAGVWATLSFNLAGFFTAIAGSWILPDGPLNVCLLAGATALAGIIFPNAPIRDRGAWRDWLIVGASLGLAGLSKYQAVFFGFGVLVFFLSAPGRWRELLRPAPVAAAMLALAIVSPVIIWNAQRGWVSFLFQGARGVASHGPAPLLVLEEILGEAGLLLPWIFAPLVIAAWRAAPAGWRDERRWYCLVLGVPAIVLFSVTSFWAKLALPHWSMPGWLMLFPLMGDWLAHSAQARTWPRRWALWSTVGTLVVWAVVVGAMASPWVKTLIPSVRRDPSTDMAAWTHLRQTVQARQRGGAHCLFLAALNWRDGGKIGAAVGDLAPVRVLSVDPRGFGFLTNPPSLAGCDALVIGEPDAVAARAGELAGMFASVRSAPNDREGRSGADEIDLAILDARGLKAPLPVPYGL
jgi:4-amino-4-deoxy-L-arabinose transferase-like glycosyltransferase